MAEQDREFLVGSLAHYMREKLDENSHKNDKQAWLAVDPNWLLARLLDEVEELAIEMDEPSTDYEAVWREAADVANFAGMIADNMTHARFGKVDHVRVSSRRSRSSRSSALPGRRCGGGSPPTRASSSAES